MFGTELFVKLYISSICKTSRTKPIKKKRSFVRVPFIRLVISDLLRMSAKPHPNRLSGPQEQEDHAGDHQGEVQGLGLEVLFAEEEGADGKAHEDAAAADHGDDGDEGVGL